MASEERSGLGGLIGRGATALYAGAMSLLGVVLEPLQRVVGVRRMPWVFLLPNLLIFGLFILFPEYLHLYISLTGVTELFQQERPYTRLDNYERLLTFAEHAEPYHCIEDRSSRPVPRNS